MLNHGGATAASSQLFYGTWAGKDTNTYNIALKGHRYYLPGDRTIPIVGFTTT